MGTFGGGRAVKPWDQPSGVSGARRELGTRKGNLRWGGARTRCFSCCDLWGVASLCRRGGAWRFIVSSLLRSACKSALCSVHANESLRYPGD